jgi:hypothetical protein
VPSGASPVAVSRQPTRVQLGEEVAAMINSQHRRIATATAILTLAAGSVPSRDGTASRSRPAASRHRIPRLTAELSVTSD